MNKNFWSNIEINKNKLNRFFKIRIRKNFKNKIDDITSVTKRRIYFKIYGEINSGFFPTINFNAYQGKFNLIKTKNLNWDYHNRIALIKSEIKRINRKPVKFNKLKSKFKLKLKPKSISLKFFKLQEFLYIYNYFFFTIFVDLFYLIRSFKTRQQRVSYFLILTFNKNKLAVNLQNHKKRNYFFLSSGLFIKFFEKKKSFKKNKIIKILMAKCIRKLFIISKIKNTALVVKHTPVFLLEILNFINTPILHKFENPLDNSVIDEIPDNSILIKFLYFVFLDNKSYVNNKMKKKGRIKRKILRKIVLENKIID